VSESAGENLEKSAMSEARTVWHAMDAQRNPAVSRHRTGLLLAVCLLCAVAAAQVLFLYFVAGPDSVNLVAAAEGIPVIE
jgi:hypothetical protein